MKYEIWLIISYLRCRLAPEDILNLQGGEQRSWREEMAPRYDQTHEDTNYIENNFILREGFKEKRSKWGNSNQTLF